MQAPHRHASLHAIGSSFNKEDLARLDFLLRHPRSARHIFGMLDTHQGGLIMFRELTDGARSVEIDYDKAMAMSRPVRMRNHP